MVCLISLAASTTMLVSTKGGFILEINKLETTRREKKSKPKSNSKTKSNQNSQKKQKKCNLKAQAKQRATKKATKKEKKTNKTHKQNTKGSLEGPGRVSTGQGSFLVPGQVSHFWSLLFYHFFQGRVKSRTFGSLFFRFMFAFFAENMRKKKHDQKCDFFYPAPEPGPGEEKKRPKVHQKVDPPSKVRQKAFPKKCARKPG